MGDGRSPELRKAVELNSRESVTKAKHPPSPCVQPVNSLAEDGQSRTLLGPRQQRHAGTAIYLSIILNWKGIAVEPQKSERVGAGKFFRDLEPFG